MLWVMYTTLDYTSILPERTLNRNTQNCRYPVKLPDNSWGGTIATPPEVSARGGEASARGAEASARPREASPEFLDVHRMYPEGIVYPCA